MRPTKLLAAAALILGSAACVGSLDTMGPGDDDDTVDPPVESAARQMFESTVRPYLEAACQACHMGPIESTPLRFLGNSGPTGFYTAVTNEVSVTGGFNPDLANLMLMGDHGSGGRALTAQEISDTTSWLLAEADERGIETDPNPNPNPTPGTAPRTSREALAQWSSCMSIDDWNTTQVYQWADKGSDRGQCMSCHNAGAGGFYAADDPNEMFEMNRYEIFIATMFTAAPKSITDPSQGYQVLPNEAKLRAKANAVGHPSYNPDGGNQMAALLQFYDLTKARIDNGTCVTTGFPEAPPAQ